MWVLNHVRKKLCDERRTIQVRWTILYFCYWKEKKSICLRWNEAVQFLSLKLSDFTTLNMHLHLTNLKASFVMMMSELRYKLQG